MALYSDSQEGAMASFFQLPAGTLPRRRSDTGYGSPSMMARDVPPNLPRRASDPVRHPPVDPLSLPKVQRYNSMNNMKPTNASDRHHTLAMHGYTRSDGSLQRYPFAPRPPSISENVAMENMTVDGMMNNGEQNAENEIVLPDDVVQYLGLQNSGSTGHNYSSNSQTQGYQAPPLHFHGQRRMAMVDSTLPQVGHDMQSYQGGPNVAQQPFSGPPDTKNNMPVQWNEVSSGTMDTATKLPRPQQHPVRSNLAVVQQRHTPGSLQGFSGNQQVVPVIQNFSTQGHVSHSHQRPMNPSVQQQHYQRQCNSGNFNEQMNSQQGFNQDGSLHSLSGNSQPVLNTMASAELQRCGTRTQMDGYCHVNQMDQLQNYSIQFKQHQQGIPNRTRGLLQPRPPNEPKSFNQQLPGSGLTQPSRTSKVANLSPSNISSEASPKRQSEGQDKQNSALFYTGQIQMFEPNSINDSMSPCDMESTSSHNSAAATMASLGVNQVSSSTVDSSSGQLGATEHAQIDFDTMLDDGDHSSLMSGTLSPGLLQSLSQTSSRLTTPRNSVALTSVPTGIGNMAIGDMNSMLTALAEESKFLNMIS